MTQLKQANQQAFDKLQQARPAVVGLGLASDVVPGMEKNMLLHAGPPIEWQRMSGPLVGAVLGAILYEGWAQTPDEARAFAAAGKVRFDPCHHHQAVGPMAGVVSPSMPVWILEDENTGKKSFATLNEGLGKVLRMGAFDPEVLQRLHWMKDVLYPVLRGGVESYARQNGGLNLKNMVAQALHMGDELHNRNKAATSLMIRTLAPFLVESLEGSNEPAATLTNLAKVFAFMGGNDHFFLNPGMAAAKLSLQGIGHVEGSSLVSVMARNGTDFGIQVAGLGNRWFTCPAAQPDVLLFPGFTPEDVNPDIGDSAIMETYGVGGFALACAPAIVQFVGGTPQDATNYTLEMYEICIGENQHFTIPSLDFRGTPTGIDLVKVVQTGITPVLDTGAAHKEPGKGQVGAGIVRMPSEAFVKAAEAFVEEYEA